MNPLPALNFRPLLAGFCITFLFLTPARSTNWQSASAPEYDRLFQNTNGWIGADGDFAVALTNNLTLWLFSDTFIGEVRDGRRTNATMIHNSIALQHDIDPTRARLEFLYRHAPGGQPDSFLKPADGKGWFWLFDGSLIGGKLFLFLTQIEPTGDKSVFGFRRLGASLGEVANPFAPPAQWRVTQEKIPFVANGPDGHRFFGSALLVTNGFVYIYGIRDRPGAGKSMILGRAPAAGLDDFATWQFRTRNGWDTNVESAADLCPGMADEYSVSWSSYLQQFVLIYTENGLSAKILARTASEPWGVWSRPTVIYRCPEANGNKHIFCYAAKAHPQLSPDTDELIVTYAANAYEFAQIMNDARLYWPRFVRVKFPENLKATTPP